MRREVTYAPHRRETVNVLMECIVDTCLCGVLFYASMQPHSVQNIGDTPATYYVINWASPGSKTKKIPPKPAPSTAQ